MIYGQPFDIKEYEILDENKNYKTIEIKIWCLELDTSKPFLVTIKNFKPWCYLEIPKDVSDKVALDILRFLQKKFSSNGVIHGKIERRNKLFYYQNEKDCFKFIKLFFHNNLAMTFVNGFIENIASIFDKKGDLKKEKRCLTIEDEDYLLRCWEGNKSLISNVRRLFSILDLKYAQWMKFQNFDEIVKKADNKIHNIDEYIIILDDRLENDASRKKQLKNCILNPEYEITKISKPLIASFDIETYSQNHKAFPNAINKADKMYMVSCVFQTFSEKESRERHLFYLTDTLIDEKTFFENETRFKKENTFLHPCIDERDIFLQFEKIIIKKDPDIFTGYNIHSFDYDYMLKRGERAFIEKELFYWPQGFSRNKTVEIDTYHNVFKSAAYGINKTIKPIVEGRISIDMMTFMKRSEKLEIYKLDFVAKTFLNAEKDDVSAFQMFEYYAKAMNNPELNTSIEMCKVGSYALQDSELVIDLFENRNVWQGLVELSSVAGVTIEDTFKGQQARVFSLLYDLCYKDNIVIDDRNYKNRKKDLSDDDEKSSLSNDSSDDEAEKKRDYEIELEKGRIAFKGAYVGNPIPGVYNNVICVDFTSLYPSIAMAYNLSFDTFDVKTSPIEDIAFSGRANDIDQKKNILTVKSCDVRKTSDSRYKTTTETKNVFDFADELDENNITEDTKRYHFEFVNKDVKQGIFPRLVLNVLEKRKLVKQEMVKYKELYKTSGNPEYKSYLVILDQRQLAYKIIANSAYGFLSAQTAGKLPCVEIAMTITARGRKLIKEVNKYVADTYGGKIVYGDSVSGETPIYISNKKVIFKIIKIEDLQSFVSKRWKEYSGKEIIDLTKLEFYVWSEKGFTKIYKLIRHKINKPLIRVFTRGDGFVDCTLDHSLVEKNTYKKIKPFESVGVKLLNTNYYPGDEIPYKDEFFEIQKFNNQVEAQKHWIKYSSIGYDLEYTLGTSSDEFNIKCGKFKKSKNTSEVVNLLNIEKKANQYVYDLETDEHLFAAGVGNIVVHNTDSSMFILPDQIKTAKECTEWGHRLARELTALFPPPLNLEFEKAMRLICFKKKKYAAYLIHEDGSYNKEKILYRGIVMARRDNFSYLRDIYKEILHKVLEGKNPKNSLIFLLKSIQKMFEKKININQLSLVTTMNENYKLKTFKNYVFGEVCRLQQRPIEPGERIKYILVNEVSELDDPAIKKENLGLKMRTLEMFDDTKETIDYFYYLEHYFQKPLDQLFEVAYPQMKDLYEYQPNCKRSKLLTMSTPIGLFVRVCKDTNMQLKRAKKPALTIENYMEIINYIFDKSYSK